MQAEGGKEAGEGVGIAKSTVRDSEWRDGKGEATQETGTQLSGSGQCPRDRAGGQ